MPVGRVHSSAPDESHQVQRAAVPFHDLARLHEGSIEIVDAMNGLHVRVSLPVAGVYA